MPLHAFSRTELIVGHEGVRKLADSSVAVFGVGGVGSYTVEALARAGVGRLVLVDDDCVCLTNINRQLPALRSTVGKAKVDVMRQRLLDINPKCQVETHRSFVTVENAAEFVTSDLDYIVDAIDTVSAKLALIKHAYTQKIPIIACMGAGNKLDPTRFEVVDIAATHTCPLAKVLRKELRKAGIERGVKVVYSTEPPRTPLVPESSCATDCVCPHKDMRSCTARRQIPGSISFVPSVAGLIAASVVVNDLLRGCLPE